ncbi:MAG: SdpI family protein [Clostridia bacterium]|nr:SdpI family protein [Clostridia bacterium]
MLTFITTFICNLLVPLIMIVAGYMMYKKPPKDINNVFGYRTSMSKKNKDTWEFAHNYCGRLWFKLGIVLFILMVIVQMFFVHSSDSVIGNMTLIVVTVQLVVMLGSIMLVEKALKGTFDENGVRR